MRDDGMNQTHLPNASFEKLLLLVPPNAEQIEISDYLERKTLEFDALIVEAERTIDLLQERRTALISAAVTGKIDVRGLR
jgi:type I restriction enzyme S subunit